MTVEDDQVTMIVEDTSGDNTHRGPLYPLYAQYDVNVYLMCFSVASPESFHSITDKV